MGLKIGLTVSKSVDTAGEKSRKENMVQTGSPNNKTRNLNLNIQICGAVSETET